MASRSPNDASLRQITLRAAVLGRRAPSEPYTLSKGELASCFNVGPRTIENWCKRGCPVVRDKQGVPRFPLPAAGQWVIRFRQLDGNRRAPAVLQLDFEALRQQEMLVDAKANPGLFVLVPLEHDHVDRERLLRRAAEGAPPFQDPGGGWTRAEPLVDIQDGPP